MSSLTVIQSKITKTEMLPSNMSSIDGLDLVQVRDLLDAELFSSDVSYLYGAGACVQEIKSFDAVSMFRDMKYFMYAYEGDMVVFYSKEIILKFLDDNLAMDYLQYLQMDYKRMVLDCVYEEMASRADRKSVLDKKDDSVEFSNEENAILNKLLLQQGCELPTHFGSVFINTCDIADYHDKNDIGYVYAFENKALGAVKIGKTKNPNVRINQLQNASGCKDDFFVCGEVYNYHDIELELHDVFADKNHMSEWFYIDIDTAIKSIKCISGKYKMPSNEQLSFSALIDRYNGVCSYNGICAGFNSTYAQQAKLIK